MLNSKQTLNQSALELRTASEYIQDIIGFKKLSRSLLTRSERLEKNLFTVALFGAFSAGKSSFANALLGERVLPVSPNPMTAAISKIKPINESYPHETVLIKLKEERAMLEDVNHALKIFDLHGSDLA